MLDLNNLPEVKTTRYRKSLLLNESPRLPHFFEYSWTQTNLKRQKLKQWRTHHQLITEVSHSWKKSLMVLGPPLECLRNHGADQIYINPWGLLSLFVYLNKCFVFSSEVFLFKYIKVLLTKRVFKKFVVKKKKTKLINVLRNPFLKSTLIMLSDLSSTQFPHLSKRVSITLKTSTSMFCCFLFCCFLYK